MHQKKNRLLVISICLSIISILITAAINLKIASNYINASGKNKALFGLQEIYIFGYQYYLAILGIIAFLLALYSINKYETKSKLICTFAFSVFAITIVFVRIWRLFI